MKFEAQSNLGDIIEIMDIRPKTIEPQMNYISNETISKQNETISILMLCFILASVIYGGDRYEL